MKLKRFARRSSVAAATSSATDEDSLPRSCSRRPSTPTLARVGLKKSRSSSMPGLSSRRSSEPTTAHPLRACSPRASPAARVSSHAFQPLIALLCKQEYLCARVVLSQIDDEDDRDMVSIRAFANVLECSPIILQQFIVNLLRQELDLAQSDVNIIFRDSKSTSTRFLDVVLEGTRKHFASNPIFIERLESVGHEILSLDMEREAAVQACMPSLFCGFSMLALETHFAAIVYMLAETLRRVRNMPGRFCLRWSATIVAFLKVICPAIVTVAMDREGETRKLYISIAKALQSYANRISAAAPEQNAPESAAVRRTRSSEGVMETDSLSLSFDQFTKTLFDAGKKFSRLCATDDSECSMDTDSSTLTFTEDTVDDSPEMVKNFKALYRIVKRKMPQVKARLEEISETHPAAAGLIGELDAVRAGIEEARRLEEVAKAEARAQKTATRAASSAKRKKPVRQGLYSVG